MVHACKKGKSGGLGKGWELSVAEAQHRLGEIVPWTENLRSRPEMLVEHGEPGERIVELAKQGKADLIGMAARNTTNLSAATHPSWPGALSGIDGSGERPTSGVMQGRVHATGRKL